MEAKSEGKTMKQARVSALQEKEPCSCFIHFKQPKAQHTLWKKKGALPHVVQFLLLQCMWYKST